MARIGKKPRAKTTALSSAVAAEEKRKRIRPRRKVDMNSLEGVRSEKQAYMKRSVPQRKALGGDPYFQTLVAAEQRLLDSGSNSNAPNPILSPPSSPTPFSPARVAPISPSTRAETHPPADRRSSFPPPTPGRPPMADPSARLPSAPPIPFVAGAQMPSIAAPQPTAVSCAPNAGLSSTRLRVSAASESSDESAPSQQAGVSEQFIDPRLRSRVNEAASTSQGQQPTSDKDNLTDGMRMVVRSFPHIPIEELGGALANCRRQRPGSKEHQDAMGLLFAAIKEAHSIGKELCEKHNVDAAQFWPDLDTKDEGSVDRFLKFFEVHWSIQQKYLDHDAQKKRAPGVKKKAKSQTGPWVWNHEAGKPEPLTGPIKRSARDRADNWLGVIEAGCDIAREILKNQKGFERCLSCLDATHPRERGSSLWKDSHCPRLTGCGCPLDTSLVELWVTKIVGGMANIPQRNYNEEDFVARDYAFTPNHLRMIQGSIMAASGLTVQTMFQPKCGRLLTTIQWALESLIAALNPADPAVQRLQQLLVDFMMTAGQLRPVNGG
ncbi:hypothetical protein CERSUDRAFT_100857 [Gelatoporia subvermispora B]|uniref:Uncharacterized protein n=1 Tax=Ceriporiopsis subvermispora (strain B) TaxID=914234 RepID=M2QG07_CERS8|nr:hypothetical protein CERSUDRAFT_100857 [Gelatoporia subvermispora B]